MPWQPSLLENNTGLFPKAENLFRKVINNFVVGGDETNSIADSDGELRIVGAAENENHEKRVSHFDV